MRGGEWGGIMERVSGLCGFKGLKKGSKLGRDKRSFFFQS